MAMGYCFSGCGSCPGHWMIGGLRYIILQIISIFLYWVGSDLILIFSESKKKEEYEEQ
jgi:hypothetical protein